MKYKAKPFFVEAFVIVRTNVTKEGVVCKLDDYREVVATPEMTARMHPRVGDFWVVQDDGYVYLNPRHVFERKYELV